MKSKLIVASKANLLFVVLGFFLPIFSVPIAGNINGVQVANMLSEFGLSSYSFLIWLIPIFAFVSILGTVIYIGYLSNKKTTYIEHSVVFFLLDFIVYIPIIFLVVSINAITNNAITKEFEIPFLKVSDIIQEILNIGAYLIAIGFLASFILLISEVIIRILAISENGETIRGHIDKLPIIDQMILGFLILITIALAGFGVFFLVDILLLDFDPIGKIFSSLNK